AVSTPVPGREELLEQRPEQVGRGAVGSDGHSSPPEPGVPTPTCRWRRHLVAATTEASEEAWCVPAGLRRKTLRSASEKSASRGGWACLATELRSWRYTASALPPGGGSGGGVVSPRYRVAHFRLLRRGVPVVGAAPTRDEEGGRTSKPSLSESAIETSTIRIGGSGDPAAPLPHHRTCGSASGGSES